MDTSGLYDRHTTNHNIWYFLFEKNQIMLYDDIMVD